MGLVKRLIGLFVGGLLMETTSYVSNILTVKRVIHRTAIRSHDKCIVITCS